MKIILDCVQDKFLNKIKLPKFKSYLLYNIDCNIQIFRTHLKTLVSVKIRKRDVVTIENTHLL